MSGGFVPSSSCSVHNVAILPLPLPFSLTGAIDKAFISHPAPVWVFPSVNLTNPFGASEFPLLFELRTSMLSPFLFPL